MNSIFYTVIIVFCVLGVFARIWNPPWAEDFQFRMAPVYAVLCFVAAVINLVQGHWIVVGISSVTSVAAAWVWWHEDRNRRRRKKLFDGAAGRVMDAGGRLKVVRPTPES